VHTWLIIEDGIFSIGITPERSDICEVADGIAHSCHP
jgi:hypothetical protein